jgi:hypothetical protein
MASHIEADIRDFLASHMWWLSDDLVLDQEASSGLGSGAHRLQAQVEPPALQEARIHMP